MSQLGWIDFSPDDRNKVKQALAMLTEPGTLDELGIGQVRDAFSDLLFPGISTIQTRAKYFITVPRILRDYQDLTPSKKRSYKSLEKYLSSHENEVAKHLVEVHDENELGIIGSTRIHSGGVDRRPSVVYWNGLRTFSIIHTQHSLSEFCRYLESNHVVDDEFGIANEEDSNDVNKSRNLISLPDDNSNWLDQLNLQLQSKEATFLKDKIIRTSAIADSVLAQLFKCNLTSKALSENRTELEAIDVLAEVINKSDCISEQCKSNFAMANEFSLAMVGPHIRYNILLLSKENCFEEQIEAYEKDFDDWKRKVDERNIFRSNCADDWLKTVEQDGSGRVINNKAKYFVCNWCKLIQDNADYQQLDEVVKKQAIKNKGGRSLLKQKVVNDRWMGIKRLDYRWSSAKIIIQDIQDGLNARTEY